MSTGQSGDCIKEGSTHDCLLSKYWVLQCAPCWHYLMYSSHVLYKVGVVIILIWYLWLDSHPQLLLSLSTFNNGFTGFMWDKATVILACFVYQIWLHGNQLLWGCSEYLGVCKSSILFQPLWEPPMSTDFVGWWMKLFSPLAKWWENTH